MSRTGSPWVEFLRVAGPVLILGGGVVGYFVLSSRAPVATRAAEAVRAPLVETIALAKHDGSLDISTDGVVVPYREVTIAAEVAGRIVEKSANCRTGNFVRQGELLFEINPRDYELEVRRLKEELSQSEVNIKENAVEISSTEELLKLAEEDCRLQKKELERTLDLAKRSAATDSEMDRVKRAEVVARNTVTTLKHQVDKWKTRQGGLERARDLAQAKLERAELDLQRTKILAPFDGVVISEGVERDSYIEKGKQLVVLEDTAAAEVKCSLRVEELYWLWQQQDADTANDSAGDAARSYRIPQTPVTVVYRLAGHEYRWNGRLCRYDGIGLDEKTRTVPCRVVVEQPRAIADASAPKGTQGPPALVRGMYVTVQMHAHPQTALLTAPEAALRPGNLMWVVRDSKLYIQSVRIAETVGDTLLIDGQASGLASDEHVVVSPIAAVKNGMEIREQATPVETAQQ